MKEINILTPEFLAFADQVKELFAEKERKIAEFKETYKQHRLEIDALDKKANALKERFLNIAEGMQGVAPERPESEK